MAEGLKLDLGCSKHKLKGYIGLDILRADYVDVVCDARKLPFADNCVSEVYSRYALEHIPDNLAVISELFRVCKHNAVIKLILPHFSNPAWSDDLTHVYKYSTRTFEHYDHDMHELTGHPNYLPDVNIKVESAQLGWWPPQIIERKSTLKRMILGTANWFINTIANAHPFLCERIWCSWVGGFYDISYIIRVIKSK